MMNMNRIVVTALAVVLAGATFAAPKTTKAPKAVKAPPPPPKYGEAGDVTTTRAGIAADGKTLFATIDSTATKPKKTKVRGIAALSLSDPARPALISTLELDGPYPQDLVAKDGMVYVVDGLNLWTVNAKNPTAMQPIAKTPLATEGEKGPRAIALAEDGKTAYLACGIAGVAKVDLSTPAAPKVVWTAKTKFSRGVAILGDAVVSAEELSGLAVVKDGKVVATSALDVGGAVSVRTDGSRIYVANGARLVQVWEFADGGLRRVGAYGMPPLSFFGTYSYDAVPADGKLYVADGESGVYEMDVSAADPKVLRESGKLNLPSARALTVSGGWLYASVNSVDGPSSIFAFNLADSLQPVDGPVALDK